MSELKIQMTPEIDNLVKTTLETALATALVSNTEGVIKEIVKVALSETQSKFGARESVLKGVLKEVIQKEAITQIKEWIEANRNEIRIQVGKALSESNLLRPSEITRVLLDQMMRIQFTIKPFVKSTKDDEDDDDYV